LVDLSNLHVFNVLNPKRNMCNWIFMLHNHPYWLPLLLTKHQNAKDNERRQSEKSNFLLGFEWNFNFVGHFKIRLSHQFEWRH